MTLERLAWLEKVVDKINHCAGKFFSGAALHLKEFLWAYASITSRAFPKSSTAKKSQPTSSTDPEEDWVTISEICLYPVLDMLNHKRNFKIEWVMSDEGVSFVSREPISAFSQVFNNYGELVCLTAGPKGNENLLANYGFVLEDNAEDYVKLTLNTKKEDPLAESRKDVMSLLGLTPFHLLFLDDTRPSHKMVQVAQIMVANDVELKMIKKGQVTLKNKMTCLQTLYSLLSGKLSVLISTNDKASLCDNAELLRMASVYRRGQEKILQHHLDLVQTLGMSLLQLDIYTPFSSPRFLCTSSDIQELQSVRILSGNGNENPPDEFILLSFILVELEETGHPVFGESLLAVSQSYDAKKCKKLLGPDEYENFKDFYESEIVPLLSAHPQFGGSRSRFLRAFTLLSLHGGDFPSFLVPMQDSKDRFKELFGVFLG
ncbi:hypothetical protein HDU91_007052 [Kappamyces sp. JEL0680]|nr:hypothetical protein HDU91_007052 [Kappamyces sp. JEL0680]